MTTGERLRFARKGSSLTQEKLAEKLGFKVSEISKYETGKIADIPNETIDKIAGVLNVDTSWLLGYDTPMDPARPKKKKAKAASQHIDLNDEEAALVKCWRMATGNERQDIAYILRKYGMPFPKAEEKQVSLFSDV